MINKTLRQQIQALKRKKLLEHQIVSLDDYRSIQSEDESYKIVIVDDDESVRNGLKRILEREGYQTMVAHDGMELAKHIEAHHLDLIFLDVDLPWVTGLELCDMIKSNPTLKKVPVICISAHKSHADIERAFAAGCNDFVAKPFEVSQIITVIEKSLLKSS